MNHESTITTDSKVLAGVRYTIRRMSFAGRMELLTTIGDAMKRQEFLAASPHVADSAEAALLRMSMENELLRWGFVGVDGLRINGNEATLEAILNDGPEELAREILGAIEKQTRLTADEEKN
ncbi:MAG: hypothetical protein HYZ37_10130 [Candidatus Solibacter usitatus]|nr:hypothetical protein [Candidatus Solibacter usitatus]